MSKYVLMVAVIATTVLATLKLSGGAILSWLVVFSPILFWLGTVVFALLVLLMIFIIDKDSVKRAILRRLKK